jgi:hypothetical protein
MVFTEARRAPARAELPSCRQLPATTATTSSAWVQRHALAGAAGRSAGRRDLPGFPAAEVLYNEDGSVRGVATGNMGVGKDGEPTENFQLGMELLGKYTVFAEGARGHLGRQLIAKYKLDAGRDPQTYGLGVKEVWEIDPKRHQPGFVLHSAGWPMDERHLRRRVPVPHGGQQGHHGLHGRPGLQQPVPEPVRGIPALEDCTPTSAGTWKATRPRASSRPSASATARAPSRRAACCRCPRRCSRAARWWAAKPAT